jgi:hypothetical protein
MSIIALKVGDRYVCERVEDCARYRLFQREGLTPLDGWHQEKKFLHSLLDLMPTILSQSSNEATSLEDGTVRIGLKRYLPILAYTYKHAERVFSRNTPYWYDVACAVKIMQDAEIKTVNIIYFQISPFVCGVNKYLPNYKSFRVDLEADKATIDLKPSSAIPLSYIAYLPDDVLPSRTEYWNGGLEGNPCNVCHYASMCHLIHRDSLTLEQVLNKEFQI